MIRLDNTLRKLQIVLAGAVATSQLSILVSYSDKAAASYNGATTPSVSNSIVLVDICAAPAAATIRDIDFIGVQNVDTASATATVFYNDNGVSYTLAKATLAVGDRLTYVHGSGWQVLDGTGALKTVVAQTGDTKTVTALADAIATLSAAQMRGGLFTITPTVGRALTTDTAANIIASLPVGTTTYRMTIVCLAAFAATLTAGANVALVGSAVANNASGTWLVLVTSATTVSIYRE